MLSSYQSVFRAGLFCGRVAIVTGAGSGLGRCNAHQLSSLGAKVALIGRKLEKLSWDAVVRTNLTGGFLVARECYTQCVKAAGGGAIVNIIADMWQGMPGMGHSGAARLGTESEVSAAICYLLSPAAAFVSGSCLRVDGAVPNAKRKISNTISTPAFDGFHLASRSKVLR